MTEKQLTKKYISVDIESSGLTPGKYSMISLGACIVGDTSQQFYREIRPISYEVDVEAMKIAALGLRCLEDVRNSPECNLEFTPHSDKFNPKFVLFKLEEKGERPQDVMNDFADWIKQSTQGFKPVMAAAPIVFDGIFINYYFDNFYEGKNPFGYSGEDINSFYRGLYRNIDRNIKDLKMRPEEGLPHNALQDAIQQAKEFEKVLEIMRTK